ncbi:MAG: DUF2997 domain-containing protein [Candidatus Gastranaerophilales bacterium]|nr:DUF2997 domain-containing protein [Candidatus Gastranaerophilales bacterium]
MAKKQLKIKLLPNGEIKMETVGVKGKKCLDYVEMLKLLADVKIQKQEYTNEYYEEEENIYIQDSQDISF